MWAMATSIDLYSQKLTGSLLNCLPHAEMVAMIAAIVELITREWSQLCITVNWTPYVPLNCNTFVDVSSRIVVCVMEIVSCSSEYNKLVKS